MNFLMVSLRILVSILFDYIISRGLFEVSCIFVYFISFCYYCIFSKKKSSDLSTVLILYKTEKILDPREVMIGPQLKHQQGWESN